MCVRLGIGMLSLLVESYKHKNLSIHIFIVGLTTCLLLFVGCSNKNESSKPTPLDSFHRSTVSADDLAIFEVVKKIPKDVFEYNGNLLSIPSNPIFLEKDESIVVISSSHGDIQLYNTFTKKATVLSEGLSNLLVSTASKINDDEILIIGEDIKNKKPFSGIFSIKTGTYDKTTSMHQPRKGYTASVLKNKKVLIAGGYVIDKSGRKHAVGSLEVFDPTLRQYKQVDSQIVPRAEHKAFVFSNEILLIGGEQKIKERNHERTHEIRQIEILDAETLKVKQKVNPPETVKSLWDPFLISASEIVFPHQNSSAIYNIRNKEFTFFTDEPLCWAREKPVTEGEVLSGASAENYYKGWAKYSEIQIVNGKALIIGGLGRNAKCRFINLLQDGKIFPIGSAILGRDLPKTTIINGTLYLQTGEKIYKLEELK